MAFDLGGYVDVPTRLRLALKDWPQLRIQETSCELQQVGEQLFLICIVTVWRDERDAIPVVASAAEQVPGKTPYTRNAERMVGFTSALGRALGYMGYGIDKSIASQDEIRHRQNELPAQDPWPQTEQQEQKAAVERIVEKERNKAKMVTSAGPMTMPQSKMLQIQGKKVGIATNEEMRLFCADTLNKEVGAIGELSKHEASKVIEALIKKANASKQTNDEPPF